MPLYPPATSTAAPTMGSGLVDFGAFPGTTDAQLVITGQTGILSTSIVNAWIMPLATADHSADEHLVENIKAFAGAIVAGTGFTIYLINTNQIQEMPIASQRPGQIIGGRAMTVYGLWSVGWSWM